MDRAEPGPTEACRGTAGGAGGDTGSGLRTRSARGGVAASAHSVVPTAPSSVRSGRVVYRMPCVDVLLSGLDQPRRASPGCRNALAKAGWPSVAADVGRRQPQIAGAPRRVVIAFDDHTDVGASPLVGEDLVLRHAAVGPVDGGDDAAYLGSPAGPSGPVGGHLAYRVCPEVSRHANQIRTVVPMIAMSLGSRLAGSSFFAEDPGVWCSAKGIRRR